ncbi:MAG: DNA replication/repair protein RecF [Aureispira sp.]|nr:DNA replication/repair protein RecF [Aureispira sp.]
MHLEQLKLSNFKNYSNQSLEFSPKLNCLVGSNGMGKTNLLDAIHYLCMCKSHFSVPDRQIILHEESFFRLDGLFYRNKKKEQIVCKYQPKQKKVFERNKVAYQRLSEHIGLLPLVMIAPDDTQLIMEGSEARRQFIDFTLVQLDNDYLEHLLKYNKILEQRNAFLKKHENPAKIDMALLEVYDQQLLGPAAYIHQQRKEILTTFKPIFQDYYATISGDKEQVDFEYSSQLTEHSLEELLIASREKDRWLQRTTKGIHKDDLKLLINGFPVKRFASQGQLKSYLLALKLGQYNLIKQKNEVSPILLLDDIFDKLDKNRVKHLLTLLMEEQFGQVFITDTHLQRVEDITKEIGGDYRQFEVIDGQIKVS